jgi:hypothetical protein
MAKTKCLYMHTLNGSPADFVDGHIVFTHLRINLWPSLAVIRKHQRLNDEWSRNRGYRNEAEFRYGYVTVRAVGGGKHG